MRRLNDGAPTAAGRRGGVERPRASLADPPSISGPAASAWRPMTAACRAHDRAALAARWPWPPPRGAAHHNHKPPQTTAAHHARHTPTPLIAPAPQLGWHRSKNHRIEVFRRKN